MTAFPKVVRPPRQDQGDDLEATDGVVRALCRIVPVTWYDDRDVVRIRPLAPAWCRRPNHTGPMDDFSAQSWPGGRPDPPKYEPIVHLGTRTVVGWTALPAPAGHSDVGDGRAIERRLSHAMGSLQAIRTRRPGDGRLMVLPVTGEQLVDTGFSSQLDGIIADVGGDAHGLVLEVIGEPPDHASVSAALAHFRPLGVRFAVSLDGPFSRWGQIPPNEVEFARVVVGPPGEPVETAVQQAAIRALNGVGVKVLASGIALAHLVDPWRRAGCSLGSGPALAPAAAAPIGHDITGPRTPPGNHPVPHHEAERLQLVLASGVLDSPPEARFDQLVRAAAQACDSPIALLTIMDATRQWIKARSGIELTQTSRDDAFCAFTILDANPLVVDDVRTDRRFASNPLVTGPPFIGSYLGVPLMSSSGLAFGALCVLDTRAREFSDDQIDALAHLASLASDVLELRAVRNLGRVPDAVRRGPSP